MKLDENTEDIHQMIEQEAIKSIGMEKAGYLNLGKSRNDQVSTALRMESRGRIMDVCEALNTFQEVIIKLMNKFGNIIIPGYTHLQHAQPLPLFHHLQAYFDAIQRDIDRMMDGFVRVNASPMGATALAGTSIAIDRRYVASLLGFDGIVENSMDAVSSRDFVAELLSYLEIIMIDFGRLAEEVILWSSKEFGFIEIADEFAATSSIMPQKKNPVVAEMVRAKCGSVLGHLSAACSIMKGIPNSYNLDLQELTPHLWSAFSDTLASIKLMSSMLASIKFNNAAIKASIQDDGSTATELANYLVKHHDVPFRQAHTIVGELVRISIGKKIRLGDVVDSKLEKVSSNIIGKKIKIDKPVIEGVLDATKSLKLIRSIGGANLHFIRSQIRRDKVSLKRNRRFLGLKRRNLARADQMLLSQVQLIKGVRN
jgi:argininosuccinate lyase